MWGPDASEDQRLRVLLFYSECSSFFYLLIVFFMFDRLFQYAGPVLSLLIILCLLIAMNAIPSLVRRRVLRNYREAQARRAAEFLTRPENARARALILGDAYANANQQALRLILLERELDEHDLRNILAMEAAGELFRSPQEQAAVESALANLQTREIPGAASKPASDHALAAAAVPCDEAQDIPLLPVPTLPPPPASRDHVAIPIAPEERELPPHPHSHVSPPPTEDREGGTDPLLHPSGSGLEGGEGRGQGSPRGESSLGPTCAICLEDPAPGEQWAVLACRHQYHKACITQWIRQQGFRAACPTCKAPLVPRAPPSSHPIDPEADPSSSSSPPHPADSPHLTPANGSSSYSHQVLSYAEYLGAVAAEREPQSTQGDGIGDAASPRDNTPSGGGPSAARGGRWSASQRTPPSGLPVPGSTSTEGREGPGVEQGTALAQGGMDGETRS